MRRMMILKIWAVAGIREAFRLLPFENHLPGRCMYLMECLCWLLQSTSMLHKMALLSDRSSELVDSVQRAQVVEGQVPMLFSSLLEYGRVGKLRTNLTLRLRRGPIRSSPSMKRSLLTYIVSADSSSPGYCSNRSFVHHPFPKEA